MTECEALHIVVTKNITVLRKAHSKEQNQLMSWSLLAGLV